MSSLKRILKILKENRREFTVPIPSYWIYNKKDFSGKIYKENLYDVLIDTIENFILKENPSHKLKKPIIYGAFVRTTTAFDFDNDNKLSLKNKYGLKETGTILRMLLLLPFLKNIGVNMIYLLPVTLSSEVHKKGEAPSPYSAKDFYKLDKYLHDTMIGEYSDTLLELQFQAFVEAAHRVGVSIILDFIPRTAARDNNLILEHPDWFYWIKEEYEKDFRPPYIEDVPNTPFSKKYVKEIYTSEATKEFLKKFSFSPDILDRKKWRNIVRDIKKRGEKNFLDIIGNEFGITTVPGFSDVINDPQPTWKDATFLRLYFDFPQHALKYIPKNQPPYVLFDVIKASQSKFKQENKKLWRFLINLIPYYQKKYNIDGARIDMGHALPSELVRGILHSVRKGSFLIAEELNINNSGKAKKTGYNAIIGNLWAEEPRWFNGNVKNVCQTLMHRVRIPVFATAETPDTPRTIARKGGKYFHLFATALNYFLPNTITFINSGFELQEKHPLNKGLDVDDCDIYLLPKNDLNYGKLGLFEFTSLHWNNDSSKIIKLMEYCYKLRKEYSDFLGFKKAKSINMLNEDKYGFGYYYKIKNGILLFLINSNLKKKTTMRFTIESADRFKIDSQLNSFLYYKKDIFKDKNIEKRLKIKNNIFKIRLNKGEISIILLKEEGYGND